MWMSLPFYSLTLCLKRGLHQSILIVNFSNTFPLSVLLAYLHQSGSWQDDVRWEHSRTEPAALLLYVSRQPDSTRHICIHLAWLASLENMDGRTQNFHLTVFTSKKNAMQVLGFIFEDLKFFFLLGKEY